MNGSTSNNSPVLRSRWELQWSVLWKTVQDQIKVVAKRICSTWNKCMCKENSNKDKEYRNCKKGFEKPKKILGRNCEEPNNNKKMILFRMLLARSF